METSSLSTSRFRFRDHEGLEGIKVLNDGSSSEGLDGHSSAGSYSVYSDGDVDSELQSMTAKGIQHLCSELLELKAESNEDFQMNILSNYTAFLKIFEVMDGLERELMQLKYQASAQKMLIKDFTERISLKALSEETMETMLEKNLHPEPSGPSKLEAHTEDVSEILDTLLAEHRLDEAISVLEMETRAFQSLHLGGNFSSSELMSYNSAISERRAMLTDQLMLLAENPRVSAPELQKALVGLCKLNNGHLASQLLLNYYHTRIARCTDKLHSPKVYQNELYIRELAKFVFSIISQAEKSFIALHGEASSHTPALTEWAIRETETFAECLNKYVRSISEISDGLSMAVEALQYAISYCSLLETEELDLRSLLINHVRPCMEQILQIHVDHYKKVISIFTSTDTWTLGRYLVSGVLTKGGLFATVDKRPQYCFLTNSGRKFVTLFQAIAHDGFPVVSLQMEGSILKALMDLFTEYIGILEKGLTGDRIHHDGSKINLAESLVQGVSTLANSLTLGQFFSNIVRSVFSDIPHLKFEIDNYTLFIQDSHAQLKRYLFQQVIQKFFSHEGDEQDDSESYIPLQDDSYACSLAPSVPYQEFYLQIRKLQKFAEDNYIAHDWLMELLKDLLIGIFTWISSRIRMLNANDNFTEQQLNSFKQLILDIQFLVEIARCGGFFSENIHDASLNIVSRVEAAFSSAEVTLERNVDGGYAWATDAAALALQTLDELEESSTEMAQNLEEISECQSWNSCDLLEDDNVTISNLFEDHSVTISSKQSIGSPILDDSDIPSPESKIPEVRDMPIERNSSEGFASVDASDPYEKKVPAYIGRDEDKLGSPETI